MMLYCMSNLIMDTVIVRNAIFGCLLIIWTVVSGLVQTSTYCQEEFKKYNPKYVNVCQDNNASLGDDPGYIVLDTARAPRQQNITCQCYLTSVRQQQHRTLYIDIRFDGKHEAYFDINGHEYYKAFRSDLTITPKTPIMYRQKKQDDLPRVCMGIRNDNENYAFSDTYDYNRDLTIRCEANQQKQPKTATTDGPSTTPPNRLWSEKSSTSQISERSSTRPMTDMPSTSPMQEQSSELPMPEKTSERPTSDNSSTLSTSMKYSTVSSLDMISTSSKHTEKEGSTTILTVVLYASIGVGAILIGIIVCCVVKRKRRSTKDVSKAREPRDPPTKDTMEHAAAYHRTDDKHEADSEYVYIDHFNVTDSALNSKNVPAESDVYNHLNEVKPSTHSDNVYSTTQEYSTTKQDSGAMAKHGTMANAAESDVYNHLNEVQTGPQSDNVYSTTHVYNTTKQASSTVSKLRTMTAPQESDVYNHLNEVRPSGQSDNIYNVANVHDTSSQEPGAMPSQYDSIELVPTTHCA